MRVLQVLRADPVHRAWLMSQEPGSAGWPFARQIASLLNDGVGALQVWAADLDPADSFLCYGNDGFSQGAWAAEHDHRNLGSAGAILAAQIAAFQPDAVLLDAGLSDLAAEARRASAARLIGFALHRSFVAKPELFDRVILPDRLPPRTLPIPSSAPTGDVLCRAQIQRGARTLSGLLIALSKAPLGLMGEFSIVYHLAAEAPRDLPVGHTVHNRGPLYGARFRDAIAATKLVIDVDEGAPPATRAERLYELAACGATILAQDSPVVRDCFTAGEEVALFATPDELVALVYALLKDDARRVALAAAARKRTSPPDVARIRAVLAESAV